MPGSTIEVGDVKDRLDEVGLTLDEDGLTVGRVGLTVGRVGLTLGKVGLTLGNVGLTLGEVGLTLGEVRLTLGEVGLTLGKVGLMVGGVELGGIELEDDGNGQFGTFTRFESSVTVAKKPNARPSKTEAVFIVTEAVASIVPTKCVAVPIVAEEPTAQ